MLEVSGVTVGYGARKTLNNVSFCVSAGTVVGIVGPRGSGKTTLLKAILNIVSPSGGAVTLNGKPLSALPCSETGYQDESPFQFDFFTPREALLFERALRDPRLPEQRISETLRQFDLTDYEDTPLEELTDGLRKRVALAATFMSRPTLLLLDEPLNVIDMPTALILKQLMREAAARGAHVLISSHVLHLLDGFVDEVVFLDHGSIRNPYDASAQAGDANQNISAGNSSIVALSSLMQRLRR